MTTEMRPVLAARVALGSAALVILGAALVGDYGELRGPMFLGSVGILILLAGFRQWHEGD